VVLMALIKLKLARLELTDLAGAVPVVALRLLKVAAMVVPVL
tara:strand:- start:181 stop:306 length:126 start_codon:yes stop_codon:yes gene_type:complete